MLFVRIASRPLSDLRRGYSYAMGQFGEPEAAHVGLSGYRSDDLDAAIEALDERMGVVGPYTRGRAWMCVYEGDEVGVGPDGEELCRPTRLVAAIDTRCASSCDEMVALAREAIGRKSGRTVWVAKRSETC